MLNLLGLSPSLIGGIGDARAMTEDEFRLRDMQFGYLLANTKPSWEGMENYRSPYIGPHAPEGWVDWFRNPNIV